MEKREWKRREKQETVGVGSNLDHQYQLLKYFFESWKARGRGIILEETLKTKCLQRGISKRKIILS